MSDTLTTRVATAWRAERDAEERLRRNMRPTHPTFEHFEQFERRETADDSGWPKPDLRIVEDGRAPPPTLDRDAQPAGWGDWIANEAAARDCPQDYLAAALICAASAWIGNSRHIAVNETWSEPPHLWLALIGAPSTGKTPALKPIIECSRAIERDAEPEWQGAMAEHARLAEAALALEEQWRTDVRTAAKSGQAAPSRPFGADPPEEPPRRALSPWMRQRRNCNTFSQSSPVAFFTSATS